nr:hypothetical protein [Tanacetum cinerariifolium]
MCKVKNGQDHLRRGQTMNESLEETDDCKDLKLQATTNFKADHIDAYDLDYDNESIPNVIFMENLSHVASLNDDTVVPRYDSDTLFEVPHYDTYHDSDVLNSNIQELRYTKNIVSTTKSCDELKGNSDVISYTNYMLTIRDDADNYVPPRVQKNDMMLSIIKQMKSQVEKYTKVIPKVVEKNDLSKSVTSHLTAKKIIKKCTKVLAPVTLQELLEQARALRHLDEHIGRVSSTNASESKLIRNTKNDMIPQPSSRSMKNKVEAHHSKFKSSANKNNHVSNCNANVKNVALSKTSDTICLSCNECLFSANHDACDVHYLKKMQKRKVAEFAKQKVKREWKPTRRIFKTLGLK